MLIEGTICSPLLLPQALFIFPLHPQEQLRMQTPTFPFSWWKKQAFAGSAPSEQGGVGSAPAKQEPPAQGNHRAEQPGLLCWNCRAPNRCLSIALLGLVLLKMLRINMGQQKICTDWEKRNNTAAGRRKQWCGWSLPEKIIPNRKTAV